MLFGHRPGVIEAEAVALDIVDVAGGNTVELFEDMFLLVGGDADAVVPDTDFGACISGFRRDVDADRGAGVFDGVVYEVTDDV